jgi:predicted RND superfamily exporter protein
MLEHFLFNIEAIGLTVKSLFTSIFFDKIFLGFIIGFFASTGIHSVIVSSDITHIPTILACGPEKAFKANARKNKQGSIETSYSNFLKEYNQIRIAFYSAALVFCILVSIAMLSL